MIRYIHSFSRYLLVYLCQALATEPFLGLILRSQLQEAENIIRCLLRHVRRSGEPSRCGEAGAALDGEGAAQRMQAEHPPGGPELQIDKWRGCEKQVLGSPRPCLNCPMLQFPHLGRALQIQQEAQNVCKAKTSLAPSPLGHQLRQLRQDSKPLLTQQALHNP